MELCTETLPVLVGTVRNVPHRQQMALSERVAKLKGLNDPDVLYESHYTYGL